MVKYFWIRVYDYKYEEEMLHKEKQEEINGYASFDSYKGVMLEEYYLKGEGLTRDECKKEVTKKTGVSRFAKGRKNIDCIYAIVMESNEYYYNRFTVVVDTVCFNPNCGCKIKGKAKDYPSLLASRYDETIKSEESEKYYTCGYDCYRQVDGILRGEEGEWQTREGYKDNGRVYGYIYHIFNRKTCKHYIGQTMYMPFFRWQEHVKDGLKGDICDLIFETIAEIRLKSKEYVNEIEAWWINKYIDEYGRDNVMNISMPKVTIQELVEVYSKIKN